MTRRDAPPPPLPTHGSPEQALAVFECLHALREQLLPQRPMSDFDPNGPF
ncbi:hypothetical protein [Ramlibacter sp. 2FC]|nr:hypothetical protein [Ramlibacter sp. 2FC]